MAMIYGIGIDLVDIQRIRNVIERWGDRFINRVFTVQEIEISSKRLRPYSAFAIRFAAKEACSKALGLGMRNGVRWRDIEVFNDSRGKPGLNLYGTVARICQENNIQAVHLTLSDEANLAIAMVILEKKDESC